MKDKPTQRIVNKPMRVRELVEELLKQDQNDYVYSIESKGGLGLTSATKGAMMVTPQRGQHPGVRIEFGECH